MLYVPTSPGNPALQRIDLTVIPDEVLKRISRDAFQDPRNLVTVATTWPAFAASIDFLSSDAEPTLENFAYVFAMFRRLQRAGVQFSAPFISLMERVNKTAIDCTEDGDSDHSDQWLDLDDADTDFHGETFTRGIGR